MLCSVSNVSFLQWFRPGPRWGANSAPQGSICRQGRQGFTLAGKPVTPSEKFPQKCSQGRLLTLAEGHVRLLGKRTF